MVRRSIIAVSGVQILSQIKIFKLDGNISSLKNQGIRKVAVVSGLLNSEDPKEEAIIIIKELSYEN